MSTTELRHGDPLRVADLVPLRRMLGSDSVVVRVKPDGSVASREHLPLLFLEAALRRSLSADVEDRFDQACRRAAHSHSTQAFEANDGDDDVVIAPVFDPAGLCCQFLLCWVRHGVDGSDNARLVWADLSPDAVVVRYRTLSDGTTAMVEASPWWIRDGVEPVELWPQHAHVAASGLAHAVMQLLIVEAIASLAAMPPDVSIRVEVPSGEMLAGIVPIFHGVLGASGASADRVTVAVPVAVATEPDLLPVIVHLRTMGLHIDIVGLDALTATLHTVSDTSSLSQRPIPRPIPVPGPWADTPGHALDAAA